MPAKARDAGRLDFLDLTIRAVTKQTCVRTLYSTQSNRSCCYRPHLVLNFPLTSDQPRACVEPPVFAQREPVPLFSITRLLSKRSPSKAPISPLFAFSSLKSVLGQYTQKRATVRNVFLI